MADDAQPQQRGDRGHRHHGQSPLLETTDLPVERIATDCGFGSAATLRRHFRHTLATSPDAYRRTFTTAPATA